MSTEMQTFRSLPSSETLDIYDVVQYTDKIQKTIKKQTTSKPCGICITQSYHSAFTILQKGIINHISDLDYKLNTLIYVEQGKLTITKTKYKVGVVIPQGIYLDFTK